MPLDVALGYCSNLEFATDLEVKLSFVRDLCNFARLAVERNDYMNNSNQNDDDEHPNHEIANPPTFPSNVLMTDQTNFSTYVRTCPFHLTVNASSLYSFRLLLCLFLKSRV